MTDGRYHPVTSPVPGIFYQRPKPGADPYVVVGQRVTEDTVVAMVEVMKQLYEVTAGRAGTVAAVLVRDEELVEIGQDLFHIE